MCTGAPCTRGRQLLHLRPRLNSSNCTANLHGVQLRSIADGVHHHTLSPACRVSGLTRVRHSPSPPSCTGALRNAQPHSPRLLCSGNRSGRSILRNTSRRRTLLQFIPPFLRPAVLLPPHPAHTLPHPPAHASSTPSRKPAAAATPVSCAKQQSLPPHYTCGRGRRAALAALSLP